jgi:hypothetical protein
MPNPKNVSPGIGNIAAYQYRELRRSAVVSTGRAVVVMVNVDATALVLVMVRGLVDNVQAAPAGTPAEQDRETEFGKKFVCPAGTPTCTW